MGSLYQAYVEVGPKFTGFADIKKQGEKSGREYGKAMAEAAVKAAQANARNLGEALAKARSSEADAAGKVRVAEAKLNEVRASGKATASQVAAAEESLAAAQRKSAAAADTTKSATEALAKAQKRVSDAAEQAGKLSGGRFSSAFKSGLSKMGGDKEGKAFATRFGVGMNGAIGGIVSHSAGLFVAGFAVLKGAAVFGDFISQARDAAAVARVSAQVVKSTGGAAKVTAKDMDDLAVAISNKTGAEASDIQSGENLLATFTGIRNEVGKNNDIFSRASQAAVDMASAMDKGVVNADGLKAANIQLGKALNDPVKGITALTRVGVSFTDQQQKQIKTLVAAGNTLGAQKVILAEVGKEFGGAAAAASDPLKKLGAVVANTKEKIGAAFLPVIGKVATALGQALPKIVDKASLGFHALGEAFKGEGVTSGGFVGAMEHIGVAARTVFGIFKSSVLPTLKTFGTFVASNAVPAVRNLITAFRPLAKDIGVGAVAVFQKLAPAIKSLGGFVAGVLPAFKNFTGFLKDNKTLVGAVAVGVGAIVVAFKAYQGALFIAATAGKIYAGVQALINVVMDANPIGIVVLALVGLAAGLVYAYKHSEKFRDIVNGAFNAVKTTAVTVFGAVKTAVGAVVTAFEATKNAIGTAVSAVGSAFGAVKAAIGTAFSAVTGAVGAVVSAVKSAFGAAVGFVKSVWSGIVSAVSGPVKAVLGVLNAVWSRIMPILVLPFYIAKSLISKTFAAIQAVFSAVAGWVKGTFAKAWNAVVNVLSGPVNLAKAAISKTWTGISAAFTAAKGFVVGAFSKAWSAVKNVLVGPVNLAKSTIDTTWSGIKTAFNATKNFVTGSFAKAWAAVKNVLSGPISLAKSALDTLWSGIKGAFNAVQNYVTGTFSKAWAALKLIITTPISLAVKALTSILGAAKGGVQWVFSQAVSGISSIWTKLQGLAKAPIKFIVNTVLNGGLIAGFNWIADKFQAPKIPPIPLPKGFARGGHFSGRLPGPPSSVDNLLGHVKGRAFGLAGGEYVINARQTAKHLPMLKAINEGRHGYAGGGLIGSLGSAITTGFNAGKSFVSGALDFLKDPVKWLKGRFAGPLGKLGQLGNSAFAKLIKAVPQSLVSTITDKAKSLLGLGPAVHGPGVTLNIGPQVGTGAARWKGVALSALSAAGEPASWINSLLRRMQQESGGNPNAINLWDSNAAHGDPSRGLMQTIMATFRAYAGPYASRGIYDPFANIYAAIKYTVARYGSGPAGWDRRGGYKLGGLVGYETGAWKIPRDQIAKIHKGEMVIPAKPAEYLRQSVLGFGQQKIRGKLHQLHEAHLAHVAHVDHLNHENDWARLIGRPRRGTLSGDMTGGGLITLHPDTIDAIGEATAGALKSSPVQIAVDLDGRKLDTALSRSALGRGF